mmetsp:Transcript_52076/g.127820  ORF Transcript_52076/g.127820 Transcript_52076/m.127820 type:complete len:92 (+) Transcript_52076:112-387(+)
MTLLTVARAVLSSFTEKEPSAGDSVLEIPLDASAQAILEKKKSLAQLLVEAKYRPVVRFVSGQAHSTRADRLLFMFFLSFFLRDRQKQQTF